MEIDGPLLALIAPDPETLRALESALGDLPCATGGKRLLLPLAGDVRAELMRRLGPAVWEGLFRRVKVVTLAAGEATAPLTDQHLLDAVTLPLWISRVQAFDLLGIIEQKRLGTLFSAVVDIVDYKIIGYEALTRGIAADGSEISADDLFGAARQEMLISVLDRAAIEHALEVAARSDLPGLLFVNIEPGSLLENAMDAATLQKFCRGLDIPPTRVILELTRAAETTDPGAVTAVLKPFREFGFRVSLDDLGAGLATFDLIIQAQPDFAKLHQQFVRRVNEDPTRRQILASLASLCAEAKIQCIAEGVSNSAELGAVQSAEVPYAQGWFFGQPEPWNRRSPGSLRETTSWRQNRD